MRALLIVLGVSVLFSSVVAVGRQALQPRFTGGCTSEYIWFSHFDGEWVYSCHGT